MGLRKFLAAFATKRFLSQTKRVDKRPPIEKELLRSVSGRKNEPESNIGGVEFEGTSPKQVRPGTFKKFGERRNEVREHLKYPFTEVRRGNRVVEINVRNPYTGEIDTYDIVRDRNGSPLVKVQYPNENRPRLLTYPQFADAIKTNKRTA